MSGATSTGRHSERCEQCNDEILVTPGTNDRHVKAEIRWSSGTGMTTAYLCGEDCAVKWSRAQKEADDGGE